MWSKVIVLVGLLCNCKCNGMTMTGSQSIIGLVNDYGIVHFYGIFTTSRGGGGAGARLAVSDINAHNLRMGLPIRAKLCEEGESGCGARENPVAIFTRIFLQTQNEPAVEGGPERSRSRSSSKPIILAGCHSDCLQLAQAGVEHDAITMCYGLKSISPPLPDVTPPTELFMMEPEFSSAVVTPLLKLILHFGWRKVAVLNLLGDPLAQSAEIVSSVLEEHDVQVGRVGGDSFTFSQQTFALLQQHSFKVLVAVVGGDAQGRDLFCGIYQSGMMTSSGYVWIVIGPDSGRQWSRNPPASTSCGRDQLLMGAEGHLTISPIHWHPDLNLRTISNRTASSFRREVGGTLGRSGGDEGQAMSDLDEAALSYDAVWAAYIAVASSMLQNGGEFPADVDDSLGGVNFPGVSGPVSFQEGRRSIVGVTVRVDQFRGGRYSLVGHHFNANNSWGWTRPAPFGPVTPGDGFGVGEVPIPEIPFWPPPRESIPPPLKESRGSSLPHPSLFEIGIPIAALTSYFCTIFAQSTT